MRGLILGNSDYRTYMTDENEQLQAGLVAAGWDIAGAGYGDGCSDVPTLLAKYNPDLVFMQDVREWWPGCAHCFNPAVGFTRSEVLAESACPVVTVLKDAATAPLVQQEWILQVRPTALVVYYHPDIVRRVAPWLPKDIELVRTYHSVNRDVIDAFPPPDAHGAAISGFWEPWCYPLRTRIAGAPWPGLSVRPHPGYHNRRVETGEYLEWLARYRVHIATASRFDFALRKIFETVAVGAIPVTNLSTLDQLPAIDDALVRIDSGMDPHAVESVVAQAILAWTPESAQDRRSRACAWYDYRAVGQRLSEALCTLLAS